MLAGLGKARQDEIADARGRVETKRRQPLADPGQPAVVVRLRADERLGILDRRDPGACARR